MRGITNEMTSSVCHFSLWVKWLDINPWQAQMTMMRMFLPCSPGQQVITAVSGRRVECAALQCVISHAARDISSLSAGKWKPNCRTILSHGPVLGPRPAWTRSIGVLRRQLPLPRSLGHCPGQGWRRDGRGWLYYGNSNEEGSSVITSAETSIHYWPADWPSLSVHRKRFIAFLLWKWRNHCRIMFSQPRLL